jgi:predicted transcriptional regulator
MGRRGILTLEAVELRDEYFLTLREIAAHFGVTESAVCRYLKKVKILRDGKKGEDDGSSGVS